MSSNQKNFLLFLSLFVLRTGFGLLQARWFEVDQLQTYLIGLKSYTTGTWPWFGPDVNGIENGFHSQIPGALEGLLVGVPFHLLPIPEAPFLFLNLMSTAAVLLLAAYIHRRLPALSYPWLCLWIAIAPWSLHEATTVLNPSYVFLPSTLFFIGFLEATPTFSSDQLPAPWANAAMGLSIFWIMQFHFSYVYLLPLVAFSFFDQWRKERGAAGLGFFSLGALPPLGLVIPTYLKFGLGATNVASGFAVPFNWSNVGEFTTILARFLSLVSFEMPRFIGQTNHERYDFLLGHPLLLVPGAVLWIAGILQAVALLVLWFKKDHPAPGWAKIKWLLLMLWLMVEVSFWFTVKLPIAHIYFVLFPFIMFYSCYVWALFAGDGRWRTTAKVFLALGLFFQVVYALQLAPQCSIYPQREKVAKALQEKDYRLMGERRAGSLY